MKIGTLGGQMWNGPALDKGPEMIWPHTAELQGFFKPWDQGFIDPKPQDPSTLESAPSQCPISPHFPHTSMPPTFQSPHILMFPIFQQPPRCRRPETPPHLSPSPLTPFLMGLGLSCAQACAGRPEAEPWEGRGPGVGAGGVGP